MRILRTEINDEISIWLASGNKAAPAKSPFLETSSAGQYWQGDAISLNTVNHSTINT